MAVPVTISSKTTDIVTSIVGPFAGTFAGIGTWISWQNLRLAYRDEERKKRSDIRDQCRDEARNRRRSTSTGSDDEGPRPRDDNSHYRRAAPPADPLLTATFEVSSSPGPPVQEAQDGRGDEEITHPTAYQRERLPSIESGGTPTLEGGSFSPNNIMLRQIQMGGQIQGQEGKYPVTTPDPVLTPPTTVGTKAQLSSSASPRNVSLPVCPDSPNSAIPEQKTLEQRFHALRNRNSPTPLPRQTPLLTPISVLASLPPVPTCPLQLSTTGNGDGSDSTTGNGDGSDDGDGDGDGDESSGEGRGWAVCLSGSQCDANVNM
jgi:hypothetical protein